MGRIISLANQKGGVGKTTTTISLGAALAELGQRVLLVDLDPQGALTVGVGVQAQSLERTIYDLMLDSDSGFGDVVLKTAIDGCELLPANIDLSAAEVVLVSEVAREMVLRRELERVAGEYDFVLIDCPPSLGLLTINALSASHGVIIPLECEFFALRGVGLLVDTIQKVAERLNPQLEIQGVVATMFDGRTIHAREVLERAREAFGAKLYASMIPRTVRFAEAPVVGEPILKYARDSKGAQAYRDLAKEVLGIGEQQASDPAGSGDVLRGERPAEAEDPAGAGATAGGDTGRGAGEPAAAGSSSSSGSSGGTEAVID